METRPCLAWVEVDQYVAMIRRVLRQQLRREPHEGLVDGPVDLRERGPGGRPGELRVDVRRTSLGQRAGRGGNLARLPQRQVERDDAGPDTLQSVAKLDQLTDVPAAGLP